MSVFLDAADLVALTGRKLKTKQIEALRKMGVPFHVNAVGKPVVTTEAVAGRKDAPKVKQWEMPSHGKTAKQA